MAECKRVGLGRVCVHSWVSGFEEPELREGTGVFREGYRKSQVSRREKRVRGHD